MRTLHSYLLRQVVMTLGMTVLVFTFILLLGGREILMLLLNKQASFGLVLHAIALLIPTVMVFALPMGMVTATLLVFGRFSADQELTAVRASGISLLSLITPLLLMSLALSIVCGWINLQIAPASKMSYKQLLFQATMDSTATLITEDRFITEIPGHVIYARKRHGAVLDDVWFYTLQDNEITQRIHASSGSIAIEKAAKKVSLHLTNAIIETIITSSFAPSPAALGSARESNSAPALTNTTAVNLTTNQALPSETNTQTTAIANNNTDSSTQTTDAASKHERWQSLFSTEFPVEIDLGAAADAEPKPKLSEMTFQQLKSEIRRLKNLGIEVTPAIAELNRQVAFSFASLGFTLIGIPLGIRAHRRETSIGVAIALVLVLVYYSFFILGQSLESKPKFHPQLIFWIPNFFFQIGGAALLWRANRG